jgi:plasmid stability protein
MGQVIVRKLDERVIAAHKRKAAARGVSLEQQLRDVLAATAGPSREELIADLRRIRRMTPHRLTTDSAELIREDRDSRWGWWSTPASPRNG